ncbi:hypothetical protein [Rubinisphaera italica]|uniref:Uncharacterized protein n=1 Tax=Rubinisphaera italica TaxID=2527969 RepID=A0A5C5XF40_9PLAN|nr:hypothetical protein [Rubinisphaera italica]TWT60765.1 hypothetical protein Pan54_14920 [Rubinisphaera italica]
MLFLGIDQDARQQPMETNRVLSFQRSGIAIESENMNLNEEAQI